MEKLDLAADRSGILMQHKLLVALTVLAMFLSSFLLQNNIDSERDALGLSSKNLKTGSSTVLELLGGLRTTAAAFLWIKVDRVHDNYYGNFDEEAELIPLYRIVTWLNPHIDEAYYVGSYMLYKFGKPEEGWKFNEEGLKMNPGSGKLELNAGQFELAYRKNNKNAVYHFERALALLLLDDEKLLTLQYLRSTYKKLGLVDKAKDMEARIAVFQTELKEESPTHNERDHNHDH